MLAKPLHLRSDGQDGKFNIVGGKKLSKTLAPWQAQKQKNLMQKGTTMMNIANSALGRTCHLARMQAAAPTG